jgi:hypothetical protein
MQKGQHAWIDVHGEGQRKKEQCTNAKIKKNEMRRE